MIAILQPHVPHYREVFFKGIQHQLEVDIFCYEGIEQTKIHNFKNAEITTNYVNSFNIRSLLFYNPIKLLDSKYSTLVLMLSITHLTTWIILLLNKVVFRKKIILWGHGISIHNYEKESTNPNILRKWMIRLANEIWFYTENEKMIWQKEIPNLKAISLNNTLAKVDEVLSSKNTIPSKKVLREKYAINTAFVLIYCARFNEIGRRADLLVDIISKTDPTKFTFIIIGNGKYKPDFSKFLNVLDYGELYDEQIKNELFSLSDLYIQPGWLGLSIVEAMAHGLGILSFQRSDEIPQCVEYGYIKENDTGVLVRSVDEAVGIINPNNFDFLTALGKNAFDYASNNLKMERMIQTAIDSLKKSNTYL